MFPAIQQLILNCLSFLYNPPVYDTFNVIDSLHACSLLYKYFMHGIVNIAYQWAATYILLSEHIYVH